VGERIGLLNFLEKPPDTYLMPSIFFRNCARAQDIELLEKLETSIRVEAGILDGEIDLKRYRLYQEGLSGNE
jgi:hypothetical protein